MRRGLLPGNWRRIICFLICALPLWSARITGTFKDPSGLTVEKAVATLKQPGVSDDFRMRVPIYAEFGKKADSAIACA